MDGSSQMSAAHNSSPIERAEAILWPEGYSMEERGLQYSKGDGPPKLLSARFQVLGFARDPKGCDWTTVLRFPDRDEKVHQGLVRHADLIGDGVDAFRSLTSAGLWISPKTNDLRLLKEALLSLTCCTRVRLVQQSGWYEGSFVLPTGTIGNKVGEEVVFDGKADAVRYATAGSLQNWIDNVAGLCAGNTRLVLALSVAFAGPLNDFLQGEGGGFHFVGPSSVGKSTMLIVGGSVWGGGGRVGFGYTWRGTENGLESIARAHSGTLLVLDELGEADSRTIGNVAYMLINGTPKARSTRASELKAQPSWRSTLLSSGEIGLADKIREGDKTPRAGQLVRLVDIPADAGCGLGAFEDTKGMEPAAFAEALKSAALRTYGTAGLAFVEGLVANREQLEVEARERIKAIKDRLLAGIPSPDGQVHRVADRFALAAASGELARTILDLPWAEGEAEHAAAVCFQAWREARGGDGSGELLEVLAALRTVVEREGESRFRSLDVLLTADAGSGAPYQAGPIRDLLGYRFMHGGELIYGFTASGWTAVVGHIGRPSTIAKMLADLGMLVTQADQNHRFSKRIDGRPKALYALKASALADGEAE
jgi:putative DNA primase/helicase